MNAKGKQDYTILIKDDVFSVIWDYNNDKIDKKMEKEYYPKFGDKLNMMWVENLKSVSGWVKGEKLYCDIKTNCDGCFYVSYSKEKEHNCYDLIIEQSGYVVRRYKNYYTLDENQADKLYP